MLMLLVWHSLHVLVGGSQRCYLVSNLSMCIYKISPFFKTLKEIC